MTECLDAGTTLAAIRKLAVVELHDDFGWSHRQVADLLGIHRNRAANIVTDP